MRRIITSCVPIGEAEAVRLAKLSIAGASGLRNLREPENDKLVERGSDLRAAHAVVQEVTKGDRQIAIVAAAVACKLELHAIEHLTRPQAEHAIGRRLQHLDQPGSELARNPAVVLAPAHGNGSCARAKAIKGQRAQSQMHSIRSSKASSRSISPASTMMKRAWARARNASRGSTRAFMALVPQACGWCGPGSRRVAMRDRE